MVAFLLNILFNIKEFYKRKCTPIEVRSVDFMARNTKSHFLAKHFSP